MNSCKCAFIVHDLVGRKKGIENAVYTDAEQQQGPNHYANILKGGKQSEYFIMEIWSYHLFTFYLWRKKEQRALHKTVSHLNITQNPKELPNITNTVCTVTAWNKEPLRS